jgi:DNA primase small subunit
MEVDAYQTLVNRYFRCLFPFEQLTAFLSQDKKLALVNREFVFVYTGDTYERKLAFADLSEFRTTVLARKPRRIEIGCAMTAPHCYRHEAISFVAGRDLVFDVDLSDYDPLRFCCKDAAMCEICWGFIVGAIKVLQHLLIKRYGFKRIVFFFSGRRGVHCWVVDPAASLLSEKSRGEIIAFLRGEKYQTMANFTVSDYMEPLMPSLRRIFESQLVEHGRMFTCATAVDYVMSFVPKEKAKQIRVAWTYLRDRDSMECWEIFKQYAPKPVVNFLVLHYLYPRVDADVTIKHSHVLKCPFSPHPGTGKISVPIDPMTCADWATFSAIPTLESLDRELNANKVDINDREACLKQTKLYDYVKLFERLIGP